MNYLTGNVTTDAKNVNKVIEQLQAQLAASQAREAALRMLVEELRAIGITIARTCDRPDCEGERSARYHLAVDRIHALSEKILHPADHAPSAPAPAVDELAELNDWLEQGPITIVEHKVGLEPFECVANRSYGGTQIRVTGLTPLRAIRAAIDQAKGANESVDHL